MHVSWRANELIRFWGHEVKGHRAHYVCKIACYRVISRTDWWIPAKLDSCMYLAELMNWIDFGVTRSKFKGHRAHYVCKIIVIALSQEPIYGITAKLESCMYLAELMKWLDFGFTRSKVTGLINVYTNSLWSHYHEIQRQIIIKLKTCICILQSQWTD